MRLYGYWRSSSAWRVRIALHLKGVAYDSVSVDLRGGEQRGDAHTAVNPQARVPVLEWTEGDTVHRLTQSMAIVDWLDHRYPDPPLFPADPLLRARAIELAEIVNSGVQPLQNSGVLEAIEEIGGERAAWAARWIASGLRAVQQISEPVRGRYLCGDTITVADLFLVPQMYGARRFGVDLGALKPLVDIETRLSGLDAFVAADAANQPDADP